MKFRKLTPRRPVVREDPHKPVIRAASPEDAAQIAPLLEELGYPNTAAEVAARLSTLAAEPGGVFVATEGEAVVGVIAITWIPMIHLAAPLARITTLVIAERVRRTGLGQQLLDHATQLAVEAGCENLEVTTRVQRADAKSFYAKYGFVANSVRLSKSILPPAPLETTFLAWGRSPRVRE